MMKRACFLRLALGWVLGCCGLPVGAASVEGTAYFEKHIRPLLDEHCYKCHSSSADKIKGGLVLDSQEGWMNGGDSGEALVPGKPGESLLIRAVRYTDPDLQMPPKYQLSEGEIELLERWVRMGAPDPRTGSAAPVRESSIDVEAGQAFWAFQAPSARPVPAVSDDSWVRDPLDRFVLARLDEEGLKPVGDANRRVLIRRVSFDLVGLPPAVDEVELFVNDPGTDDEALARVVDRLLASRQFGERWGRHWLDVVRYAESMGRTRNWPFPLAWRYRDYVLDAFNADKPYDQFVREQLAGDLMKGGSEEERNERLIATGFLALGALDLNERDALQFKMDTVDEQVDVTGRAFMALTTGCARCHDHKFDPIPTEDYYAMAGIFKSTDLRSGYGNRRGGNQSYFQADMLGRLEGVDVEEPPPGAVRERSRERRRLEERLASLTAEMQELNRQRKARRGVAASEARQQAAQLRKQIQRLRQQLEDLEQGKGVNEAMVMAVADAKAPGDCKVNIRGDVRNLGSSVPRGFLRVLGVQDAPRISNGQSGRLELAEWMTDRRHPLTARVMVNRMWHHLFGRGLVATVDNFGNSGERPSHPELLDYLAVRFMESDWSVKGMLRGLVLSRTYRSSSAMDRANYEKDPDNVWLWRMNLRRLEVEALRDAMLAVSGELDLTPVEGSPVMALPLGEVGRRARVTEERGANYRSVYLPVLRNQLPEMFEAFDFAEPSSVMGRRDVTTVSTQALFMMNNPFVMEQAERLAVRLIDRHSSDRQARVEEAFLLAFAREPSARERATALTFIADLTAREAAGEKAAWADWCQGLLASAEFRYVR